MQCTVCTADARHSSEKSTGRWEATPVFSFRHNFVWVKCGLWSGLARECDCADNRAVLWFTLTLTVSHWAPIATSWVSVLSWVRSECCVLAFNAASITSMLCYQMPTSQIYQHHLWCLSHKYLWDQVFLSVDFVSLQYEIHIMNPLRVSKSNTECNTLFLSAYFDVAFALISLLSRHLFLGRSQNLSVFPGYDSSVTGTSVLLSREKEDRTAFPFYRKSVSKICFSEEK